MNKRWELPEKKHKEILLQFIAMQYCRIKGYKDEMSFKAEQALKQNIREYTELSEEEQSELHESFFGDYQVSQMVSLLCSIVQELHVFIDDPVMNEVY